MNIISLRVKLVWSLCACGSMQLNFLHQMGVSVSAKYLKDMAQDIIFGPGEKELKMFGLTAKLLLFCLA